MVFRLYNYVLFPSSFSLLSFVLPVLAEQRFSVEVEFGRCEGVSESVIGRRCVSISVIGIAMGRAPKRKGMMRRERANLLHNIWLTLMLTLPPYEISQY